MDPFSPFKFFIRYLKVLLVWKQVLLDLLLEIEYLSTMLLQCSRRRHKVQDQLWFLGGHHRRNRDM
jgi:hypothetical protein